MHVQTSPGALVAGIGVFVLAISVAWAEPFEKAEVTHTVNSVSLLEKQKGAREARVGDVVAGSTAVKTGGESRTELEFPDRTVMRIGANALFSFQAGSRKATLEGGTMLFSAPKGEGGGEVRVGAVTAAVTGTSFLLGLNKAGEVTLTVLEGSVELSLNGDPSVKRVVKAGETVKVPADATSITAPTRIDLATLLATHPLLGGSGFGELPGQRLLVKSADDQQDALGFLAQYVADDGGGIVNQNSQFFSGASGAGGNPGNVGNEPEETDQTETNPPPGNSSGSGNPAYPGNPDNPPAS